LDERDKCETCKPYGMPKSVYLIDGYQNGADPEELQRGIREELH
jgi:hypothetical protein